MRICRCRRFYGCSKVFPSDALVLILSYARDQTGEVFTHHNLAQLFRKHCPVPIYALHEERLGYGIVGGSLQGGRQHGARAAEMALRILAGEEQIPVELKSTARLMFDYNELIRFSIPPENLPEGSIIINQPKSIYDTHKALFISTSIILAILIISVCILMLSIIKRRSVEISLRISEEKLLKHRKSLEDISKETYRRTDKDR